MALLVLHFSLKIFNKWEVVPNCLKPPLVFLPLCFWWSSIHKMRCSVENKIAASSWGVSWEPQVCPTASKGPGLWTKCEIDALYCWQGENKLCSTANRVLSPSFLWLLNSLFLCFNFYLFMQWLATASQLTDGWFPLATWGALSPSKFLSQAVSRARLLISAVLSKAWSGKLAMQIFVHFISSMSACWQGSRCLRHVSSALLVPKGQRCHLLCETQVGP